MSHSVKFKKSFDDSLIKYKEYIGLRKVFYNISFDAASNFLSGSFVRKDFSSLFDLFSFNLEEGYSSAIDKALDVLADKGYYDLDQDSFIKNYLSVISKNDEIFQPLSDILNDISPPKKGDQVSEGGGAGPFVGGGFGLDGAAQGMAIATAANLGVRVLSGTLNALSEGLENASLELKKMNYFNSESTYEKMALVIFNHTYQIVDALINALNDIDGVSIITPSQESIIKVKAKISNIKSGRVKENNMGPVVESILDEDPFNADFYEVLIDKKLLSEDFVRSVMSLYCVLENGLVEKLKEESGFKQRRQKINDGVKEAKDSFKRNATITFRIIYNGILLIFFLGFSSTILENPGFVTVLNFFLLAFGFLTVSTLGGMVLKKLLRLGGTGVDYNGLSFYDHISLVIVRFVIVFLLVVTAAILNGN